MIIDDEEARKAQETEWATPRDKKKVMETLTVKVEHGYTLALYVLFIIGSLLSLFIIT